MATQLSRSFGEQGNQRKFTISVWVKRSKVSSGTQAIMGSGGSGAYASNMYFMSSDEIEVWNWFNSAYNGRYRTSAKFKDVNAWYHIVIAVDTTQATDTDRFKLYVNGELITAYAIRNNASQNQTFEIGHNGTHYIGGYGNGAEFEGLMSHFHYCDGYQYQASDFGETDSTTGEWKIKVDPSVQYGTTGHFILKDGNSVTDQSGLSHNWTVANGTLTNTEDNPSNVFATFNPLCARTQIAGSSNVSYTNGNNTAANTDTSYSSYNVSTLGMQGSGKYYCEFKLNTLGGSSDSERFGISNLNNFSNYPFGSSSGYSYNKDGNATPSGSGFPTYSTNDIIGVAFDAGNGIMWFSKNGTWINSATISEIAAGTTTNAVFTGISTSETWHFSAAAYSNGSISANFGNGYFGTTAVSSAGTNASGNGIFEYDVPTGYTALSTKGLNE